MEVCLKAGGLFYVHTSQLLQLMYAANYINLIEPPENAVVELGTHKPSSFLSFSVMSYGPECGFILVSNIATARNFKFILICSMLRSSCSKVAH